MYKNLVMFHHQSLLSTVVTISKYYRELDRISGSNFNLFRIINVSSDELKHSLFLADLLNPKGSHGQGAIFLKLFMCHLNITPFFVDDADVEVEKSIGRVEKDNGGRLDIYISDRRGHNIVIENKIYADDQPKQLIRYHNYYPQNVLYLTLDGHNPSELSIKSSVKTLKQDEDFRIISYRDDILPWLENCRKEASQMPLLREGISHYINLIKHLTGKSNNKAMKEEIINVALQNPENLRSVIEIASNINFVKSRMQWRFWKALRKSLENRNLTIEDNEKNTVTSTRTFNYYQKKDQYFGFWIEIYRKEDITVHWGIEIDYNIYSGFTVERNGNGGISNLLEFEWMQKIVLECDSSYNNTQYWLGWKYPKTMLAFKAFNSDEIFSLGDENTLKEIVEDIAEVAYKDILFVKERLNK